MLLSVTEQWGLVPLCLSLRNGCLICIVRPVSSEPTSPLQQPPRVFIPTQSEKFLCSLCATPPSSPVCIASVRLVWYNVVCGWRNGVSACPRRSSHTLLEAKGHTGLNTTQPYSFQAVFSPPTTTIVLRLYGTALFLSLTHPQTHKEGRW